MDHLLVLLLWSSGLQAEGKLSSTDDVRLVGGASRCAGTLEVRRRDWRPVDGSFWNLKAAAVVCAQLDCGSAVSFRDRHRFSRRSVWKIWSSCVQSGSALRDCTRPDHSSTVLDLTCSDSVRLVNGTSLCSGRLEVKSNQSDQSNQRWSSVCEADFDLRDAEVVCRELGCGAPSVLQGALYGEVEAPMWTKEFRCEGHESALLDCRSSERNTCSPGRAAGLTCSEPVRLVGGSSRCAGTLEIKQGVWRSVSDIYSPWTLQEAAVVCRQMDCGSAVSVVQRPSLRSVWRIKPSCFQPQTAVRECASPDTGHLMLDLTCSDLLHQPIISASSSMDRLSGVSRVSGVSGVSGVSRVSGLSGVSEAQPQGFEVSRGSTFTISCSVQPQYLGGSFLLRFASSDSAQNYTQPAVNHSAHFLFPAAEPAHQGSYRCVYDIHIFSHDFSSESRPLSVTVSGSDPTAFIIRAVFLLLTLLLENIVLYFYCQASRGQETGRRETTEPDYSHLGVCAAEEEAAQGAE